MDARLRELERAARAGDTQALQRLEEWLHRLSPTEAAEIAVIIGEIQGALNLSQLRALSAQGPEVTQAITQRTKVDFDNSVRAYETVRSELDAYPYLEKNLERILELYYLGLGYTVDPRSNQSLLKQLPSGNYRKITIPSRGRNYKTFRGRPGAWIQTSSVSKKTAAQNILAVVNDKVVVHKQKKQRAATKAETTKERRDTQALALRAASLEIGFDLPPDERSRILYESLRNNLSITPTESSRVPVGQVHVVRRQIDEAMIDDDHPPVIFEQSGPRANATQKKLPSKYESLDVTYEKKDGALVITIGKLGVDPLSGRMIGIGSNGISGYIRANAEGLVAHLFMWVVNESRKGEGTKLMSRWCNILKAYGLDGFIGDAVGDQGRAALEALARKGKLEILGWHGKHAFLTCGEFGDPNQLGLF